MSLLPSDCSQALRNESEVQTRSWCRGSTCNSASGGKSMELRVSTDSILLCRGPLCDWDMESVLAKDALSSSISPPPPSPPPSPSSELESASPDKSDRRSPDCRFWRLYDGARPGLFQLDLRLVRPLPELHRAWGDVLRALVCSRKVPRSRQ